MKNFSISTNSYRYYVELAFEKANWQEKLKKEKEGWNIGGMYRYYFNKNYHENKTRLIYSILNYCLSYIEIEDEKVKSFLIFLINYEWFEIFNLSTFSEELTKEKFLEKQEKTKNLIEETIESIPKML